MLLEEEFKTNVQTGTTMDLQKIIISFENDRTKDQQNKITENVSQNQESTSTSHFTKAKLRSKISEAYSSLEGKRTLGIIHTSFNSFFLSYLLKFLFFFSFPSSELSNWNEILYFRENYRRFSINIQT